MSWTLMTGIAVIASSIFATASIAVARTPNARSCETARMGKRSSHAMAYNRHLGRVVLFGGSSDDPADRLPTTLWSWDGERWEWTGSEWREVRLRLPADGISNSLLPNGTRGLAVLVAVRDSASPCPQTRHAAMFEIHGDTLVPLGVPDRSVCLSPHAPATVAPSGFLFYSGWMPNKPAESWTWIDGRWRATETAPPRRRGAAAAYDERRRRVVLFGGNDDNGLRGDLWEWDGARWREVPQ